MYYLALDPGVSTGWAAFNQEGDVIDKGIIRGVDTFTDWLIDNDANKDWERPKVVVCEDYRIFSKRAKAHTGSQVPTIQVIGMIRSYARRWKAEYVLQPSSILTIAVLWSGVPLPSNHDNSHDIAAYNHGVYYLQKEGIRKSRALG